MRGLFYSLATAVLLLAVCGLVGLRCDRIGTTDFDDYCYLTLKPKELQK